MAHDWRSLLRTHRVRHGLTQLELAQLVGVSQRTVSRWERGEDQPTKAKQVQLRDLGLEPTTALLEYLKSSVSHCPAPRALSKMPNLRLICASRPAIIKRPSILDLIGHDLAGIASGVLEEMLSDSALQRSIARREVACIVCTTAGVLRTVESPIREKFRTTISYFLHDGTLYSDAISVPLDADLPCGYEVVPV